MAKCKALTGSAVKGLITSDIFYSRTLAQRLSSFDCLFAVWRVHIINLTVVVIVMLLLSSSSSLLSLV